MQVTADGASFASAKRAAPSLVSSSDDKNLSRFFYLNFLTPRHVLENASRKSQDSACAKMTESTPRVRFE